MFFLAEDLLTAAKSSGLFPNSQTTFTDSILLGFANEEMQSKLVPAIHSNREDYFLTHTSVSLVANLAHYGMPERAMGNALKDLFYVPDVNNPTNRYPLARRSVHEVSAYSGTASSGPAAFYVEGDEVVLIPTPTSGLSGNERLQFFYYQRPNKLVATSTCAKITAVSTVGTTTTFTVDTDLTATMPVGTNVDFLNAQNPFLLWAKDVSVTAITATTIAVTAANVQDESLAVTPGVSDYICLAQQANIPQIPQEFHSILSEMVVARVMKALGNAQGLQMANSTIADTLKAALGMITNRVEAEPEVVYDRDGILSSLSQYGFNIIPR